MKGYPPLKDGDILKTGTSINFTDPKETDDTKHIKEVILKHTKGTPEYKQAREEMGQKKREAKIKRTDVYETKYIQEVKNIFADQSKFYTQSVLDKKKTKSNDMLSTTKRVLALTPLYKDLMQSEGNEAMAMV
jgi:hypothetical protein